MEITNKTYMKTLIHLMIGLAILTAITSCGGDKGIEAKKAELEQLKAKQAEIAEQIKTLEVEIASSGDTTSAEDAKAKYIAVTPVSAETFEHSIDVQGRVEGDENVTITAKMGGSISRINVKAGDIVREGQILAEVEHEMTDAQIADLKTNLKLATEVYNKQKNLWEQKVGTEIQFLQAKTNKESLEQKLNQLVENEKMYKIISPINGTVDEVNIKPGQVVGPGMPCARVVNFGQLKVKADVSESYSSNIKTGDETLLVFPDINKSVKSSVSYTAKVINPMTRTFAVEIDLPSENVYRPNMVVQVRVIDYKKPNSIVVPINTVQKIDGKDVVFVAVEKGKGKVAQKREVAVGAMYNGKAEIISGLTSGEQLITTGFQDLTENQAVRF